MAVAGEGVDVTQRLVSLLIVQPGQRSDAAGDGVGDEPLHKRPLGLELWTQNRKQKLHFEKGEFVLPHHTNSTYMFEKIFALKNCCFF